MSNSPRREWTRTKKEKTRKPAEWAKNVLRYHSRLAELIALKKGEQYAKTISWIRAKTSFAPLRSALICLRGSRTTRRVPCDARNVDFNIASAQGAVH